MDSSRGIRVRHVVESDGFVMLEVTGILARWRTNTSRRSIAFRSSMSLFENGYCDAEVRSLQVDKKIVVL